MVCKFNKENTWNVKQNKTEDSVPCNNGFVFQQTWNDSIIH